MTQPKKRLLLGAHISTAGGIEKAIARGESIGCTTIQLFTKSNRQWFAKKLSHEGIEAFKEALSRSSIESVMAHAAYLINLGSPNLAVQEKSVQALIEELSRCEQLGIPHLVLHPGSGGIMDEKECLRQIATHINTVLKAVSGTSMLLLETMAGQGSNLCYRFEQLAYLYQHIHQKDRIGICLDTCHIFSAGYDLRTTASYEAMWQEFDHTLGLHLLKAIHINDSKKELGSRVDRHEHIGKGTLGLASFSHLFNDERLFHIPKVLETPKESLKEDFDNMHVITSLLDENTKEKLEIAVAQIYKEESQ